MEEARKTKRQANKIKDEHMPRISGLIFSADSIKDTIATAKHLLEFTDEVVIVYSKSYKDYKSFISWRCSLYISAFPESRSAFAATVLLNLSSTSSIAM